MPIAPVTRRFGLKGWALTTLAAAVLALFSPTAPAAALTPTPLPAPQSLRLYLHGQNVPGTADDFTMDANPAPAQNLTLNLLASPRWYSDPPLSGTFGPRGTFTVGTACLLGLTVVPRYSLAATSPDGSNAQELGQARAPLGLCLGGQQVTIPVATPLTLAGQRLRLTVSGLIGLAVTLRLGPGTYLDATNFTQDTTPPTATATVSATVTPSPSPSATATRTASPTHTPTATPTRTATPTPSSGTPIPAPATDWIRVDGTRLVDSLGREFIPRGFIAITNNSDGTDVEYTVDDFRRMRAMGANHHTLRVHSGLLGANPNWPASPFYLDRIDTIVARAKEAGLYTVLKMTIYDMPLFGVTSWASLWNNQNGEQAAFVAAWQILWDHFRNEPAVLGYDLLNEPEQGTLVIGGPQFVANYLTPFYRTVIDQLRTIDQQHLVLFQPPKAWLNYPTPLQRPQTVYAPHYYPNILDYLYQGNFSTYQYAPLLQEFRTQAQQLGVPLYIGEYGMPWFTENDGNATAESQFQSLERLAGDLMDASSLGFTRPWYADDRAEHFLFHLGVLLNWSLFRGENGMSGPERTFITNVVARPYPHLLAGTGMGFSYDHATRGFSLTYTPNAARGRTDVYVPRARHYATTGFLVRYAVGAGELLLAHDATKPSGLRVVANPGGLPAGAFAWDETRHLLTVREWLTGQPATLEIFPS